MIILEDVMNRLNDVMRRLDGIDARLGKVEAALRNPLHGLEGARPGYQLTDEDAAEVLAESEQRTQAHHLGAWYHPGPVKPAPGAPVFGDDGGREIGPGDPVRHPVISHCQCGRQIRKVSIDAPWVHTD